MNKFLIATAVLGLSFVSTGAYAASFDCSRARTPNEVTICNDPRLSDLDSVVQRGYDQAKRTAGFDAEAFAKMQFDRRNYCLTDKTCIVRNQLQSIRMYQTMGAHITLPSWTDQYSTPLPAPVTTPLPAPVTTPAPAPRVNHLTPKTDLIPEQFRGTWLNTNGSDDVCNHNNKNDYGNQFDRITVVEAKTVSFNETQCDFLSKDEEHDSQGMVFQCVTEGQEPYNVKEYWAIRSINDTDVLVVFGKIESNTSVPYTETYTKCH